MQTGEYQLGGRDKRSRTVQDPMSQMYSDAEWSEATDHRPLSGLPSEELVLLHRHWMWSNQVRESLDAALTTRDLPAPDAGPAFLASRQFGLMFVWYGLLWTVIEACIDPKEGRNLDFRGRFRGDIDAVAETLKRCRNAVLHVPRSSDYVDKRLQALVALPNSAIILRRVAFGFGRLFLDEFRHRDVQIQVEPSRTAG